jgi:hypothetical protein
VNPPPGQTKILTPLGLHARRRALRRGKLIYSGRLDPQIEWF